MKEYKTLKQIANEAEKIVGCIWTDATDTKATVSERCKQAASWVNFGSDGDITEDERDQLLELAELAEEIEGK